MDSSTDVLDHATTSPMFPHPHSDPLSTTVFQHIHNRPYPTNWHIRTRTGEVIHLIEDQCPGPSSYSPVRQYYTVLIFKRRSHSLALSNLQDVQDGIAERGNCRRLGKPFNSQIFIDDSEESWYNERQKGDTRTLDEPLTPSSL